MWTLISTKNQDQTYRLLVGKAYSLGRINCDIVEPSDKSISRKHAEFDVSHPEGNISYPHKPPVLQVKDLSKFGTAVQNRKLDGGTKAVQNGDLIKFGTMDTVYKAVYEPMVVTTSCLDNPSKKDLKQSVLQLGGHVISEWRKECSLLVMSSISVTVKVICALIQQKPIVTVKYVKDLLDSIQSGIKSPDPEEYAPPLAESALNPQEVSFKKNPNRATLFQGMTFLFISTKQFKRLNVVVELAGGKPKLIEEGTDDDDDSILVASGTVVMQFDLDDATQNLSQNAREWAKHVQDVLKTHGKRMIADSELGYAILYCSTGHYCNPDSSVGAPSGAAALPSQSLSVRPDDVEPESERVPPALPAQVKIKEEPMSQDPSTLNQENTTERSRTRDSEVTERSQRMPCPPSTSKRKRPKNDDDEENMIQPRSKRGALIKETPEKSSPSPTRPNVQVTPPRILASESFMTKSEAPAEVKEEVDDLFDELEATASRRRVTQRSKQNGTQAAAAVAAAGAAAKRESSSSQRSEVKDEVDDLFDEFDDISSTRRRRKARESQAPQKDDDEDDLPSARKRKRKQDDDDDKTNKASVDQNRNQKKESEVEDMECGSGDSPLSKRHQKETAATRKTSPRPKRNQSPSPAREPVAVKTEVQKQNGNKESNQQQTRGVSSGSYVNKSMVTNAPKSEIDTSLPVGCIQQEFSALVIRKPGTSKPRSSLTQADGTCVWEGKTYKNFKKFRKTPAPGSEGLPRLIGGNDLFAHNRSQRRDLDEWFEHVMEEETERDEVEKMAEKMFNYEPTRRTGKR